MAVGVAGGFMILASTAQTPDGFIHASFGGPLDFFSTASSDVLAIGDGPDDATQLAALLKTPVQNVTPNIPYRVAYEAGSTPDTTALNVFPATDPAGAPITQQALELASKPVVDSQGRVDCTGALSCKTDPTTKVTTVTYPDGVVALVQKVNDMTVVAYKTVADGLENAIEAAFPRVAAPTEAPLPAAAAPVPTPAEQTVTTTAPVLPPPAPETAAPTVDPGPPAPEPVIPDVTNARPGAPKVNVTRPPLDFPDREFTLPDLNLPDLSKLPPPKLPPGLDKVKDALDSVGNAIGDAVGNLGKALGASKQAKAPATSTGSSDPEP